jgi:hypothetical protein
MTKLIPLTQGQHAIVDDADYDFLMQWKWYVARGYAQRSIRIVRNGKSGQRALRLHNVLMSPPPGHIVDHINRNKLDNRRENLRITTQASNAKNASAQIRTSAYKGVHWHKVTSKWATKIRSEHRVYHLGVFVNEVDAALAYDHAARQLHGEYAVLNFPEINRNPQRSDARGGSPGEASGLAKLTATDVITIRWHWAREQPPLKVLAAKYGVSKSNISMIVNGKTWQHLLVKE